MSPFNNPVPRIRDRWTAAFSFLRVVAVFVQFMARDLARRYHLKRTTCQRILPSWLPFRPVCLEHFFDESPSYQHARTSPSVRPVPPGFSKYKPLQYDYRRATRRSPWCGVCTYQREMISDKVCYVARQAESIELLCRLSLSPPNSSRPTLPLLCETLG